MPCSRQYSYSEKESVAGTLSAFVMAGHCIESIIPPSRNWLSGNQPGRL
jgi:hypothetical protein